MSKKDVPKNQRKSFHLGASTERAAFIAFFKRLEKRLGYKTHSLNKAIAFGKKRVKRYRAIEGGL
jgi:hypothetical protein